MCERVVFDEPVGHCFVDRYTRDARAGQYLEKSGRKVGRQEQVMPLQSSPMDQPADSMLAHVKSSVSFRKRIRTNEIAHVLESKVG